MCVVRIKIEIIGEVAVKGEVNINVLCEFKIKIKIIGEVKVEC